MSGGYCARHDIYLCIECGLVQAIINMRGLSRRTGKMFYRHLRESHKVIQVWPGGRTILWPETARHMRRAQADDEWFMEAWK